MWPRICELLLAVWLILSPAFLDGTSQTTVVARVTAIVMILASSLAMTDRFRRAYLVTLLLAVLLTGYPFLYPPPATPMLQNFVVTGLVIAMFAVIPSEATRPPRGWRKREQG